MSRKAKGIILAGGAGTRLYPMTQVTTKQLLPVYDKPMIYYPLSLLMMLEIRDILIITTPADKPSFERVLGNGNQLGINISYTTQSAPNGIAEAYLLANDFLNGDHSVMVLGDNLFNGSFAEFKVAIRDQLDGKAKGHVFAYHVNDPERYGVVEFDKKTKRVISLEEKPKTPKSNYAVPGLYIFDGSASTRVKNQKPSARNELEIIDLIRTYLNEGALSVSVINRGMAWLDTGTPQALLEASAYVGAIEQRQGLKVACLEEIALRMNFITYPEFLHVIEKLPKSPYREYLTQIGKEFADA